MKIFSAQQMHEWDAATIAEQQLTSDMLMERAAVACCNAIVQITPETKHFVIAAGTGNNGGDGLCIARLLLQKGYKVTTVIIGDIQTATVDTQLNYRRLLKSAPNIFHVLQGERMPWFEQCTIIDAIFGSGLNRPVTGWHADIISDINAMDALRIAVDMPSGLMADAPASGAIIEAQHTITFEAPKLSFFFPASAQFLGDWRVEKIGLSHNWMVNTPTSYSIANRDAFSGLFPERPTFAHKGTNGSALVIAGNAGTPGAAALAAKACLTAGAGLVTLCSNNPQFADEEIMYADRDALTRLLQSKKYNAIAIGPGLGTHAEAEQTLDQLLNEVHIPIVIDADAINILAQHPEWLERIPSNSIFTPHPKECERLLGVSDDWKILLEKIKAFVSTYNCIFIYKQAYTIVATPDGSITFNASGNPGMATGGSGDVLTGIIAALIAQNLNPAIAARLGVYLHGLAGDLALSKSDGRNIIARDLISNLQTAYQILSA